MEILLAQLFIPSMTSSIQEADVYKRQGIYWFTEIIQVVCSFVSFRCGCHTNLGSRTKIFQRFYQSSKNPANSGGSGIGLHIASEYPWNY